MILALLRRDLGQFFPFTGSGAALPVVFFVDPDIVDDVDASRSKHITLSYTFYEIDLPENAQAALDTGAAGTTTN